MGFPHIKKTKYALRSVLKCLQSYFLSFARVEVDNDKNFDLRVSRGHVTTIRYLWLQRTTIFFSLNGSL